MYYIFFFFSFFTQFIYNYGYSIPSDIHFSVHLFVSVYLCVYVVGENMLAESEKCMPIWIGRKSNGKGVIYGCSIWRHNERGERCSNPFLCIFFINMIIIIIGRGVAIIRRNMLVGLFSTAWTVSFAIILFPMKMGVYSIIIVRVHAIGVWRELGCTFMVNVVSNNGHFCAR